MKVWVVLWEPKLNKRNTKELQEKDEWKIHRKQKRILRGNENKIDSHTHTK